MKLLITFSLLSFSLLLTLIKPVNIAAQSHADKSPLLAEWNFSFNTDKGVWIQSPVDIARKANGKIVAAVLNSDWIKFTKADIKGEILLLEGRSDDYGAVKVEVRLSGDRLAGKWQIGARSGKLKANRNQSIDKSAVTPLEIFDYVQSAIDKQFYDPQFNGLDWKQVSAKYRQQAVTAKSDAEIVIIIRSLLDELGTSHLNFFRKKQVSVNSISEQKKSDNSATKTLPSDLPVVWKKLSPEIGYIQIKRFDEGKEMVDLIDSAFAELGNLKSLVIDFRDNQGGTLSIGMRLGDYLFPEMRPLGYLATRKGFDRLKVKSLKAVPLSNLPIYTDYNVDGFLKELENFGIVMLKTGGRVSNPYRGRVVVLTNENSASATEGFAAVIKESTKATFIGTRTAGAMLSSATIDVPGGWRLRLPEADFVTVGGIRVEGVGVEPHIVVKAVKSEDAVLKKAMEVLTEK